MPKKKGPKTTPVTVRLAPDVVEIIEGLIGAFGHSRSDVARYLMLSRIEDVIAKELPRKLRDLRSKEPKA